MSHLEPELYSTEERTCDGRKIIERVYRGCWSMHEGKQVRHARLIWEFQLQGATRTVCIDFHDDVSPLELKILIGIARRKVQDRYREWTALESLYAGE